MANDMPVWGYELEYYVNTGTAEAEAWIKATELLTWEQAGESKTYEPAWIDRKNAPTLTYGRSCSINMEKDTMRDGALEAWINENRNALDVPCEIVKVMTWLKTGGGFTADKAAFAFTPNPASNSSQGQPVTSSGTFNMTDDAWIEGAWDPRTKKFTLGETALADDAPQG